MELLVVLLIGTTALMVARFVRVLLGRIEQSDL